MPLLICPDCGKQCSDQAPACPHCGRPMSPLAPAMASPSSDQCPQCSALMAPSMVRCPRCGTARVTPPATQHSAQIPLKAGSLPPQRMPQQPSNFQPYSHGNQTPAPNSITKAPGSHSPVIAVLLSVICCSAGFAQMYNGQIGKGIVMFCISIAIYLPMLSSPNAVVACTVVDSLLGLTLIFDSVAIANKLNRGEPVGQWEWF